MNTRFRSFLPLATCLTLAACTGTQPTDLGISDDGRLAPCPATPNCVSSHAQSDDTEHYIEPIDLPDGLGWDATIAILDQMPRTVIIARTDRYVRAEATSLVFRFVDDVELLNQDDRVDVRSASRVGKSDLGVNRKRIESLRDAIRGAR